MGKKKGAIGDGLDRGSKVIDQKSSLRTPLADCTKSMKQLKEVGGRSFRRAVKASGKEELE